MGAGTTQVQNDEKHSSDEKLIHVENPNVSEIKEPALRQESKDLTSLSPDELIDNLKVYEMIIKKDFEIVKEKVKRKSLVLKAKRESSDEECLTSRSEEEDVSLNKSNKNVVSPKNVIGLINQC
nr:alpha/beta hydrolases superfamily protein [Tanacetum cinerariifolium]